MLLRRLERQMITTKSRLKRGDVKGKVAMSSARRLEIQELLHEYMKAGREDLSCHAGFDYEAHLWEQRVFDVFLE